MKKEVCIYCEKWIRGSGKLWKKEGYVHAVSCFNKLVRRNAQNNNKKEESTVLRGKSNRAKTEEPKLLKHNLTTKDQLKYCCEECSYWSEQEKNCKASEGEFNECNQEKKPTKNTEWTTQYRPNPPE